MGFNRFLMGFNRFLMGFNGFLMGFNGIYHLIKLRYLLNMTIEIVDFPIEHGDFSYFFVGLPEGIF